LLPGVWEKIVDASFVLDIYFNFRTGYVESEPAAFLVTSGRAVAYRYLKGFFLVDFLSTVPWDVVLANDGLGFFQLVKLSKIMKLLRMARALKLVRILRLIKVLLPPCATCFPMHAVSCHRLQHTTAIFFFYIIYSCAIKCNVISQQNLCACNIAANRRVRGDPLPHSLTGQL
jgi:hypothetical protein